MATRRVKRIKRTKKQVHRARARNTRRQRGGAIMKVCEKTGVDMLGTSKGIAITYDTDSQMYTIGNHPYGKLREMPRYTDALASLEIMRSKGSAPQLSDNEFVVLDQGQFDSFKQVHCQGDKPECGGISGFRVPSAVAPAASAASAASAAAGPADDPNADIFRKMNMNELRVTEQMVAFKNNNGEVVHYPADKSKREYNFENFTIPTSSNGPIPGMLKVTFGMGDDRKRTDFALELSMSSIAPELFACMQNIERHPFVEINSITSSSSFFSTPKLIITGTLTERQYWDQKISTFDLNGFVQNFMKQYQSCMDPASQIANMRVAGPEDIARVIRAKIDMLNGRVMSDEENSKFETLKQEFTLASGKIDLLKKVDQKADVLLDGTKRNPRRPPPSVPVTGRAVPPPSVPSGSFGDASAPPPGGGGKTRRKNRIRMHRH